ncbi:MAG TPA: nuclear transport factor 2 family protein [Solirubrobacterales bacterium]
MTPAAANVEVVERAYRIWGERGLEGMREVMHDQIEWHPPPQAPEPGPFRGADEIIRVAGSYLQSFGKFRPVPNRILAGAEPDQVLVLATLTTAGRASGAEFTMPVGHLLTIRDGKIARFEVIPDQVEALAAAGLDPGAASATRTGDVVRTMLVAFNEHDAELAKSLIAPDGEIHGLRAAVEGTVYRGAEGAARFWKDLDEVWGRVGAEDPEVIERGDEALVITTLVLQGRGSGVVTRRRLAVHVEIDEHGLISRFLTLIDADAARRDFEAGRRPEPG